MNNSNREPQKLPAQDTTADQLPLEDQDINLSLSQLLKQKRQIISDTNKKTLEAFSGHEDTDSVYEDINVKKRDLQTDQSSREHLVEDTNSRSNVTTAQGGSRSTPAQKEQIDEFTDGLEGKQLVQNLNSRLENHQARRNKIELQVENPDNCQDYLFDKQNQNMFEQIAGQSVSDISPSPQIIQQTQSDKKSPEHDEEDPHPIRGIFTHFRNDKIEDFEEQLEGTEPIDLEKNILDSDQLKKQPYKVHHTFDDQKDKKNLDKTDESPKHIQNDDGTEDLNDMTDHQFQFKQMFPVDEEAKVTISAGPKKNPDQSQAKHNMAQMSSYENEIISQHKFERGNNSDLNHLRFDVAFDAAEDDMSSQFQEQVEQDYKQRHEIGNADDPNNKYGKPGDQFSFKEEFATGQGQSLDDATTSNEEKIERIKIDQLIENAQDEYLMQNADHENKFQFRQDSPSGESDAQFAGEDDVNFEAVENSRMPNAQNTNHAEDISDLTAENEQMIGKMVSININHQDGQTSFQHQQNSNTKIKKKDSSASQLVKEVVVMQDEEDEAQNSQTPISQNTMTQNLQILQSNTEEHLSISQRIQLQRVQQPVSNYQHMDVNDEQRRKSKIHGFTKFHYNKDLGDDGEEYIPANVNRNRLDFDPGCIGEDDDLQHLIQNHKEAEREDTEIDFIQQIDTDREINNHEGEQYLPVVSDNQIQINSKHQEGIVEEILTKQQRERENSQSSSRNGILEGEKNRTKDLKNSKGTKHSSTNSKNSASLAKIQKGYGQKSQMEPSYTEVYVWGDDSQGQLGLELYNKQASIKDGQKQVKSFYEVPKSCSFNVIISQVSCGQAHSAMLTASGHLYMMGQNKYGQLGVMSQSTIANEEPDQNAYKQHNESANDFQGTFRKAGKSLSTMDDKNKNMRAPCLVDSLKHVFLQKVECGANYTIAMGEKRESKSQKQKQAMISQKLVYVWGSNINGQLGLGNTDQPQSTSNPTSLSEIVKNQPPIGMQSCVNQPTLMQNFPKSNEILLDFSCGESHSLFKTQLGDKIFVYGTGLNQSGQCGLSTKTLSHLLAPTKITLLKAFQDSVSQIKAGVNHSLFLCGKTGFVYQCGGQKQSQKTFEQILIQEPILSIEASLHSAALSCSGKLYVWSSDLERIQGPIQSLNQSMKFPLQQLSLSRNFAVLLDNQGKTFIWEGGNQKFIPDICQKQDESIRPHPQIQFKQLNTKFVKSMKSGDSFVIALGRDIPSKPIRSKSIPRQPQKKQHKSSKTRNSKNQQELAINEQAFKIQMPQNIIDRIQRSQEKAQEADRDQLYPSVNQLQKYQEPERQQFYPQVNLQPQNSKYFQNQGKMNMNINLFTAAQEQYQQSACMPQNNADIAMKKQGQRSNQDLQNSQISRQVVPSVKQATRKKSQGQKQSSQYSGLNEPQGMSKSKAVGSQSSIQNSQKFHKNQSQSHNGSIEKPQQKKKNMSNELQNLQNGLQSLAKPKSYRNGSDNAAGTQQTTQSSAQQQNTFHKVNGVMACNRAMAQGKQGFLPPSKSFGVIDDKLGMKMNNANSVINSILKKQIMSQNPSYRGMNGAVDDSHFFAMQKSSSISSVIKSKMNKNMAQKVQIQKKPKKSSVKPSRPGSKPKQRAIADKQSPLQVNKSVMSVKSGMSNQSLSKSIRSINSINSQSRIKQSKEKLKKAKSIKSFKSQNLSRSRSKSRSSKSGSRGPVAQSMMLLSGNLSNQMNENMQVKNINIVDQHGDLKQMQSFDIGPNAQLQTYAAQHGFLIAQKAHFDYDIRPHSVSSNHKRSQNSRYSSGHYQRLMREKSNSKNASSQRKSPVPYNEKFECTKNSGGSVNLKINYFGRGSSQDDARTTARIDQTSGVEGDLNSKFINQLKNKIKVQKLEMRQLMDDNIKKDNNLQRLVHQVERFKRGLPYSAGFSPTSGSQSREVPILASSDAISQSFESNKQYKIEVNKLKLKIKRQNQTIRTLKDKFLQQNSTSNKPQHTSSDMATQSYPDFPHSPSQDFFVVTEQNVKLEQNMEQLKKEQKRSESLLRQMEDLRTALSEQIDTLQSKVSKKEDQLRQANSQLSELHGGIRDFQEQTHQIQNELVQKLQDLQRRYEQQIEINDKLRYQMQVLNQGKGLSKQQAEEMKDELKNKDKQIEHLQRDKADLKSLVKQMSSQLEKQNYSDLLSKVGQVIRPVLQREVESAKKSKSANRQNYKSQERVEKLIYSDKSTSKVSKNSNKSNKMKKSRKNNYDEVSQNSKRSYEKFEPKADIKDILSDKIRRKSLGVASNSPSRSYERYQKLNASTEKNEPIQVYGVQSAFKNQTDQNGIPFNIHKVNQSHELGSQPGMLKKYIIPVHGTKQSEGSSYLNRVENYGEVSSQHSNSPQKQYFNQQKEKPVVIKDTSISPQTRHNIHANAVALQEYKKSPSQPKRVTIQQTSKGNQDATASPEKSESKKKSSQISPTTGVKENADSQQPSSAQKEQSIRELREKYNQLMRQSLERKAYQRQQSSKSRE